jgi:predicted MFS family arabinose efflux permease
VADEFRPRALAIGGLLSLAAAVGIGRFIYTPILPLMVEDLRMTTGTAGLLASANFAGYLIGALLAATRVVSRSRRRWLLAGLTVSGLTTGAMAAPSSPAAFLILRFVGGVASAFGLVFASALVLDRLAAARRSELSAAHFAGVGVGIAVSAVLASSLATLSGWRSIWLAGGAASLIATAAVTRLIPGTDGTDATAERRGRFSRRLAIFATAYGLFGFSYIILATFLVAIVRGSAEVRALESVVWLVVGVAAAPSVALWTRVATSLGIARAFALACVVEAIGVAASALPATAAVLLAAALLGGTFMGLTALGLIGGRQLSRGDPRTTLAVMTAAFGLGQIAGPAFAGLVHDATGSFVGSSLVAAAALLVGAVLALASREPAA